jgi:hypothetical protein
MCHVYSTKEKIDLFFGDALEYIMIFVHDFIDVYFIKFSNVKVSLTTTLTFNFKRIYSLLLLFQSFENFVVDL